MRKLTVLALALSLLVVSSAGTFAAELKPRPNFEKSDNQIIMLIDPPGYD